MAGHKGKRNQSRTPQRGRRNRSQTAERQNTVESPGNQSVNIEPNEAVDEGKVSQEGGGRSTTRVIIAEGDSMLDMEVTASEDEMFRDEEEGMETSLATSQLSKINGYDDPEIEFQGSQGSSMNNNAAVVDQQEAMVVAGTSKQTQLTRSTMLDMEDLVGNEQFMKGFAQFMMKKGHVTQEKAMKEVSKKGSKRKDDSTENIPAKRQQVRKGDISNERNRRQQMGQGRSGQFQPIIMRNDMTSGATVLEGDSQSEITIYKCAVKVCEGINDINEEGQFPINSKSDSNSSDELVNLSDESAEGINYNKEHVDVDIADEFARDRFLEGPEHQGCNEPIAQTSRGAAP